MNIIPRMWADHQEVYTLEKKKGSRLKTGRSEVKCKPCPRNSRRRLGDSQHRPCRSLVSVYLPQDDPVTGVSFEFRRHGEEWMSKVHFPLLTLRVTIRYLRKQRPSLPKR